MQKNQKFKNINETFPCKNCGKLIKPLSSGCRNHCPFCLHSKHVDKEFPGDRESDCEGLMVPISYEIGGKKGITLTFKCQKCGKIIRNIASHEDSIQPDDYEQILKLTPKLP